MNHSGLLAYPRSLALLGLGVLTPSLAAQTPLDLTLRLFLDSYMGGEVEVPPNDVPRLRAEWFRIGMVAAASSAGYWCIPIVDVHVLQPEAISDTAWATALTGEEVPIEDLLPFHGPWWTGSCLQDQVVGRNDDGARFVAALGFDGGQNESYEPDFADPLFSNGGHTLEQRYGLRPSEDWVPDPGGGDGFGVDALFQKAAWERLSAAPGFEFETRRALFDSRKWNQVMTAQPTLTVVMLGIRDPSVEPSSVPSSGPVPPVTNFPNVAPRIIASPQRRITLTGTAVEKDFAFWSQWSGPLYPIHIADAQRSVTLPANGYLPRMQVALVGEGGTPRYEVAAKWNGYGKVRVQLPAGAPSGTYDIVEFRYREDSTEEAEFLAWRPLAAGYRPRILLQ